MLFLHGKDKVPFLMTRDTKCGYPAHIRKYGCRRDGFVQNFIPVKL